MIVDEYNGDIARSVLHGAEGKLISAQDYLRRAKASPVLMRGISRLINGTRLLLDLTHDEMCLYPDEGEET